MITQLILYLQTQIVLYMEILCLWNISYYATANEEIYAMGIK